MFNRKIRLRDKNPLTSKETPQLWYTF